MQHKEQETDGETMAGLDCAAWNVSETVSADALAPAAVPCPDLETVRVLEYLLHRARTGHISGFAGVVTEPSEGEVCYLLTGGLRQNPFLAPELLARLMRWTRNYFTVDYDD